ncbi:MAG: hypothetical protein IK115_13810 [Lachnospiraceae bacterium]|nr:hypothetical protein [Lachnospiraceae bacterium]
MKQKKPRRGSFSKEINRMVVSSLGIAFFLIFVADAILLFLTVRDLKSFIFRVVILLLVLGALYAFYSFFVVRRIRQMFLPLDRLAWGLLRDQVFVDNDEKDLKALADSLRSQAERMNLLSKELKNTRDDLDDASRESRLSRDTKRQLLGRTEASVERIQQKEGELMALSGRIADAIDAALLLEPGLKKRRDGIYEQSRKLEEQIRDNLQETGDTEMEFAELGGSYGLLDSMHADAEELLDSLYNEMSSMQSLATQINLYAMNTSLDISRAGSITISAISALDEMKVLSAKVEEKTDSLTLLIIRIRNALKLAMDQSGECREKGEECSGSFSRTKESLKKLESSVQELAELGSLLSEDAGRLSGNIYDVKLMEERREREEGAAAADVERLARFVKDWRRQEEEDATE